MQGTAVAEKTGSTAGRGGGRMQSDLLANPSPVFISAGSRRVSSTIFFSLALRISAQMVFCISKKKKKFKINY